MINVIYTFVLYVCICYNCASINLYCRFVFQNCNGTGREVFLNIINMFLDRLKKNGSAEETVVPPRSPRPVGPVKMIVIADLHMCFFEDSQIIQSVLETKKYDCVLFLGDIFASDIKKFVSCAGGRPCLYVLGNHDEWQQNYDIDGLTDLDGDVVEICGVRIGGVSGAPRYKQDPNLCMRSEEEVANALRSLGAVDILVSHESPYHLLNKNFAHGGFQAITDYLRQYDVPLHIFGHHHINYDEVVDGTREVCVYGCSAVKTRPFSVVSLHI